MNRVQEMIDENMDQMPTALAKSLLEACKEELEATKELELYKLTWTIVKSTCQKVKPYNDMSEDFGVMHTHTTQTIIVEKVDSGYYENLTGILHTHDANGRPKRRLVDMVDLPNHGFVWFDWVKQMKADGRPMVFHVKGQFENKESMVIISSIVPYNKRAREEF